MDIFKNVQNEKPPMNLDRPFFLGSNLWKLCSIVLYTYKYFCNHTTDGGFTPLHI